MQLRPKKQYNKNTHFPPKEQLLHTKPELLQRVTEFYLKKTYPFTLGNNQETVFVVLQRSTGTFITEFAFMTMLSPFHST